MVNNERIMNTVTEREFLEETVADCLRAFAEWIEVFDEEYVKSMRVEATRRDAKKYVALRVVTVRYGA